MSRRVLAVQTTSSLTAAVQDALTQGAFNVQVVEGFASAYKTVLDYRPALVIVDAVSWSKQEEDFFSDVGSLRSAGFMRKIVVAAHAEAEHKINALDLGADDFLLRPISSRELLARIEAVLRSLPPHSREEEIKTLGSLRLCVDTMEVSLGGDSKKLSRTESNLLAFFMDNAGEVLSREVLLDNLWLPSGEVAYPRVVDVYVCRLRDKIEDDPAHPIRLVTKRGYGYALVETGAVNPIG